MRVLFLAFLLFSPVVGLAGGADHLRGWYEVTEPSSDPKEYFLVDADTLGAIWGRRSDEPLPPDLEPIRNDEAILVAFTKPNFLLLSLEKNALFTPGYMGLVGGDGSRFEMRKRADGQFDIATMRNGVVRRFVVALLQEQPEID